jgi:hypothetical protein
MQIEFQAASHSVTEANTIIVSQQQVTGIVPVYYELKRVSNNQTIIKNFNTQGGYRGSNNHPAEWKIMLEEGEYEITFKQLNRNRLRVPVFIYKADGSNTNDSNAQYRLFYCRPGQEVTFRFNIEAYNPNSTQYYKFQINAWWINPSTGMFSVVNPSPPSSIELADRTENQYYIQDYIQLSYENNEVRWNNDDVPVLPQTIGAYTSRRARIPNTPTIEVIHPNINGGVAQQVANPFYQNTVGVPDAPAILSPASIGLGSTINGTTTDYTNTILVFRGNEQIATVVPTQSMGNNGTWSFRPTTTESYKFRAKKNNNESQFSTTVAVTQACNLTNDQNIALLNANSQFLRAKTFDGGLKFYLIKVITENPLSFEVRGKNLLNTTMVTAVGGLNLSNLVNCFANAETNQAGLDYDTTFVTPAGYTNNAGIYTQVVQPAPAAPVPGAATGTQNVVFNGTANQPGTILIFKDGGVTPIQSVQTAFVDNRWAFTPVAAGIYRFKNQNDNGLSPFSTDVVINPENTQTTRIFTVQNVVYCDISPANVQIGIGLTAAAVANWTDGIVIEVPVLIEVGTKAFIRDKTRTNIVSDGVLLPI